MPGCIAAQLHKTGLQATSLRPASRHAKTRPLPLTMQLPDHSLPSSLGSQDREPQQPYTGIASVVRRRRASTPI